MSWDRLVRKIGIIRISVNFFARYIKVRIVWVFVRNVEIVVGRANFFFSRILPFQRNLCRSRRWRSDVGMTFKWKSSTKDRGTVAVSKKRVLMHCTDRRAVKSGVEERKNTHKKKRRSLPPPWKRNPRGTGRPSIDLQRHPSIVATQWTQTYAPAP